MKAEKDECNNFFLHSTEMARKLLVVSAATLILLNVFWIFRRLVEVTGDLFE